MILGIDASRYSHKESTGVEWYSYHLLNYLIPLLGREHNTEVRLYSPKDFKIEADVPFNVKKRIIPFKKLWTLVRLSMEMLLKPCDTLFVPSHTLPLICPKKTIITIHDVAFKVLKESYTFKQRFILNWSTKRAVRKASKIIVPSNATKEDLIKYFRCKPEKITVIYHGAPEIPTFFGFKEKEQKEIQENLHLTGKELYVLYIGRLETKKNLSRLIEAFNRLLKEFPGWKLVLAGKRGTGFEEIWKTVEKYDLKDSVIMPGYITEREKLYLLEHCRIFAFPSLYEGFGLPILEAFAMRRPVMTSKVSSMPEVAGDAAFLVNPEKVEELSVGLKRLAADGLLVTKLIKKGEERYPLFNWEKAAKETYNVLL